MTRVLKGTVTLIKTKNRTKMFTCEFREICKSNFFAEDFKVPLSARSLPISLRNVFVFKNIGDGNTILHWVSTILKQVFPVVIQLWYIEDKTPY